jgi:uncharacterized protein (TIGR02145 family)
MKKWYFLFIFLWCIAGGRAQGISIGTATPNPSAKMELSSSSQGFLLPRMTLAQRNAIPNPATGLVIWCTDCDEMQVYNGSVWKNMSGTAASEASLPGIKICYHTWMYQNLAVRTYRNGDPIPVVTDSAQWASLTTGAMCWYNNDSAANGATHGALYNWYAINDPRGLAPAGWRIATLSDWTVMTACLGGEAVSGGKLKAISPLWQANPNAGNSNSSGFSGLPGGFRDGYTSIFSSNGSVAGAWWTATEYGLGKATLQYLVYDGKMILTSVAAKNFGFSVRCVKE